MNLIIAGGRLQRKKSNRPEGTASPPLLKKRKEDKKKMMERRIEELLNGIYELEFQGRMTFEEFADGYDFWVDEDDILLIEGRGVKPIDGVRKVGYVDNGVVYAY